MESKTKLAQAIEGQRNPMHPLYLARKFADWADRTGVLSGRGLTWIALLPAGLIANIVSILWWLIYKSIRHEGRVQQ